MDLRGNELADRLAQAATRNCAVDIELNLEKLEYNIRIKKFILEKWQKQWSTSIHGQFYRKVEPTVSLDIKYEHRSRKKRSRLQDLDSVNVVLMNILRELKLWIRIDVHYVNRRQKQWNIL